MKVPSMRYRRILGDMILVHKSVSGNNQSLRGLLMINECRTRNHNSKLYKPLGQTIIRKQFLSERGINKWNSLPYEFVNVFSLDSFKSKLDDAWEDKIHVF